MFDRFFRDIRASLFLIPEDPEVSRGDPGMIFRRFPDSFWDFRTKRTGWDAQTIAQLVNNWVNSMVYGRYNCFMGMIKKLMTGGPPGI
jgi:hypothetical protein